MPKLSDSSERDSEIVFTANVECPSCSTVQDVVFRTGAFDEDGLTDLEPGDLDHETSCVSCGIVFLAEFSGWTSYGEAG